MSVHVSPPLHPIIQGLLEDDLPLPDATTATLSAEEVHLHRALCQLKTHPPTTEESSRSVGEDLAALATATGNTTLILATHLEWFHAYWEYGQLSDLTHLVNTIRGVAQEAPPTILQVCALQARYLLADKQHKRAQSLKLIRACIQRAPVGSSFWGLAIQNYAIRMAEVGRFSEAHAFLDQYKTITGHAIPDHLERTFVNACQSGDLATAIPLLPEMRRVHEEKDALGVYGVFRVLLELMRNHLPPQDGAPSPSILFEEDRAYCLTRGRVNFNTMLLTTRHLLARQTDDALEAARSYAGAIGDGYFHLARFDGHDMIRAELSAQHPESAALLMRKRFQVGLYLWVDDFFAARIALLKQKYALAESLFAECLKSALRYDATTRLLFELCLACELPPAILLRWSERIRTKDARIHPVPSPVLPAPPMHPFPSAVDSSSIARASHTSPRTEEKKFVGSSRAANDIRENIAAFADIDPPILLMGETGVGKELVAQQIHASGVRRKRPFVAVNCAALSSSLLLSELFGHVRGAFTGATGTRAGLFDTARDGTLFLDEIGDMAQEVQGALLRVLETGDFRPVGSDRVQKARCRIVAATNRDLDRQVKEDRFRSDLYFRLSHLEIRIPPLRSRPEDILPLAIHFLRHFHPRPAQCGFSNSLCDALVAYPWTGNARELRSTMETLCLLCANVDTYTRRDLAMAVPRWAAAITSPASPNGVTEGRGIDDGNEINDRRPWRESRRGGEREEDRTRRTPKWSRKVDLPRHPMDRLEELESFLREHGRVTCKQVLHMFDVSYPTARRILQELLIKGVIQKVEPNRSPRSHYYVYVEDSVPPPA